MPAFRPGADIGVGAVKVADQAIAEGREQATLVGFVPIVLKNSEWVDFQASQ